MSEEYSALRQPLETVCIEVPKVYDFCFETDRRENICTPLGEFYPSEGASVVCKIISTSCNEVGRSEPDASGRANVTFAVTVNYKLKVLSATGQVERRF